MSVTWRPETEIFPVIAERKVGVRDPSFDILGTGFFINADGTFLTAKHVFTDHGLEHSHEFRVMMVSPENDFKLYRVTQVRVSRRFDIALAKAIAVEGHVPLQIADADPPRNRDLLTFDYSATTFRQGQLGVTPYTRKGHIVCQRENDYPGPELALTLEMSFPALRGASGAPVILDRRTDVIGMVVANVAQRLLPPQLEPIQQPAGVPGDGAYYLPAALALHWSHLKEFVGSGGRE